MSGRRARAAADLTDLVAWLNEQLASETADRQHALERTAEDIGEIAVRMMAARRESGPERDPELEGWLSRQLQRSLPQAAGPDDLAAVRKLAALRDGTVAETVARWLRAARAAGPEDAV